jgi:hypothetical protein
MSKIKVTIHDNGQVDLQLTGFQDSSCLDATRTVERLLGNQIVNRNYRSSQLSETIASRGPDSPAVAVSFLSPAPLPGQD